MGQERPMPDETVGQTMELPWGSIRVALGIPRGDVIMDIIRPSPRPAVLKLPLTREQAHQLAVLLDEYASTTTVYRRA